MYGLQFEKEHKGEEYRRYSLSAPFNSKRKKVRNAKEIATRRFFNVKM